MIPTPLSRTVAGRRIRHFRTVQAITLTQLADSTGVSLRTLCRIEAGEDFKITTLEAVAAGLNVQPADLLTEPAQ